MRRTLCTSTWLTLSWCLALATLRPAHTPGRPLLHTREPTREGEVIKVVHSQDSEGASQDPPRGVAADLGPPRPAVQLHRVSGREGGIQEALSSSDTFCVQSTRYASLYFAIGVDGTDNELLALELIHLYVEILDRYFGNVCELDLIFNFHKAYYILDEVFLAGELQESSKKTVSKVILAQDTLVDNAKSGQADDDGRGFIDLIR
eukprot:scaffold962_cov372-Prasinococcus_capsulatus_cf.AAC.11